MNSIETSQAAGKKRQRLFYFNAGFLRQHQVRRIVELAGYDLRLGKPEMDDLIAVWGHSPYAARGEKMAETTGAKIVRIEDAFLRSLHTGRDGDAPLGLVIDHSGMHFDPVQPSDLEQIFRDEPLDDTALLDRARGAIERLQEAHLTKYAAVDPDLPLPEPGYVLVIDQTNGDASVTKGRADSNTFLEMLYYAQDENPGARILIKTHPETRAGHRVGYFDDRHVSDRVELYDAPISPWALMEGAVAVYTVSSQLGFEAIFAGHKPIVFGQPFYAGWGLTDDRMPIDRRQRSLSKAQLFAGTMMHYPKWYDPHRNCLCELEDVINILETRARAWREDRQGWTAGNIRAWKRRHMQAFFGSVRPMRFQDNGMDGQRHMVWGADPQADVRVEDGFIRSRGLGADLVPPLSLVLDELGIYYDPTRESGLEHLITSRAVLRRDQEQRIEALLKRIKAHDISKYNLGGPLPDLPDGRRILVVGQVEDDASIQLGAGEICTNQALLDYAKTENPDAVIIYKPHPDVQAGLRKGAIDGAGADLVIKEGDPMELLRHIDEVWTMTSLMGFEALIRGVPVVTTGAPFYAGWGLTRDLGNVPARRTARPTVAGLAHATLLDYPRYFDPVAKQPCPAEIAVERLISGQTGARRPLLRGLAKVQGWAAGFAHLWRRP